MARGLIRIYKEAGLDWLHVQNYYLRQFGKSGSDVEYAKLRFWGLLEPSSDDRDDDGHTSGLWRVTSLGELFVLGRNAVPRRVWLVAPQQRFDGFDGEPISIRQALGDRFDYEELMRS
jgi:hypothetical protein